MAGPSKNPFVNITLGSVVMGVLGYLGAHVSGPNASVAGSIIGFAGYLAAALFHRNPPAGS